MSRFAQRSRGVLVDVVDFSGIEAEALQWRQETEPDCTKASIHGGQWALGYKDGRVFAICTEGVGYEVTDEEPLELEFHGQYLKRQGASWINQAGDSVEAPVVESVTRFDFLPFGSYSIIPEDLANFPIKETVDLADFVRTFGGRLEDNFWLWFKELSY